MPPFDLAVVGMSSTVNGKFRVDQPIALTTLAGSDRQPPTFARQLRTVAASLPQPACLGGAAALRERSVAFGH
jgi:hypothetical protein